jgi:hypothetical protein
MIGIVGGGLTGLALASPPDPGCRELVDTPRKTGRLRGGKSAGGSIS